MKLKLIQKRRDTKRENKFYESKWELIENVRKGETREEAIESHVMFW
jgi:hypothetical protein